MEGIYVAPVTEWGWTSKVQADGMAKALEFMLRFHSRPLPAVWSPTRAGRDREARLDGSDRPLPGVRQRRPAWPRPGAGQRIQAVVGRTRPRRAGGMIPPPCIPIVESYVRALESEVKRLRGEYMWAVELGDGPHNWRPRYPDSRDLWQWREHIGRPELCWTKAADAVPWSAQGAGEVRA